MSSVSIFAQQKRYYLWITLPKHYLKLQASSTQTDRKWKNQVFFGCQKCKVLAWNIHAEQAVPTLKIGIK